MTIRRAKRAGAGVRNEGRNRGAFMSFHSFSLDPRTVLGVGPNASLDEIQEAYRAKSKKHHPDRGGDEWAFRMVVRAYEVLKTTTVIQGPRRWDRAEPNVTIERPARAGSR